MFAIRCRSIFLCWISLGWTKRIQEHDQLWSEFVGVGFSSDTTSLKKAVGQRHMTIFLWILAAHAAFFGIITAVGATRTMHDLEGRLELPDCGRRRWICNEAGRNIAH